MAFLAGAAAWPLVAHAQQPTKRARIGYLQTGRTVTEYYDALRKGLADLGYIEYQTVVFERRSADGYIQRLPALAAELVRLNVDVIVASATPGSTAAQKATATIPIVGTAMGDPVHDGLVSSLARPGGNLTGTTFLGPELVPKRLALFKELLPTLSRLAVLWHPGAFSEQTTSEMLNETRNAARILGLELHFVEAQAPEEFERAFADMAAARDDGLLEFPSPMFFSMNRRLVELAASNRLPAMWNAREFVEGGGLIAYGASILDLYRRTAFYVDKILKGARPADLPVEQPTRFELLINLKTAKTLGITIANALLVSADETIE